MTTTVEGETDTLWKSVIDRQKDRLRGFFARSVRDPNLVGDLVSETLLKGWQARQQFRGDPNDPKAVSAWFNVIAAHELARVMRHKSRREQTNFFSSKQGDEDRDDDKTEGSLTFLHSSASPDPEDVLLEAESQQEIRKALLELLPRDRTILTLHYLRGLDLKEIAVQLEMQYPTVKVVISRARERLGKLLSSSSITTR